LEGVVTVASSRRRKAAALVLVLLLLFFLRPGVSRLKSRIIASVSSGVGRPVDIGEVHVRLLPRPGFDLENLVVYEDPAFGAEPMLRASEVTAALRLTSMLRGRLEIARLDLTEPSLNLVRGANGRWNLEALVERTAHMPLAPTAKAKSERRPAFPYIQATSARINFKIGAEKKPYALTNADFSLWQDSENAWGARLKGTPVRTDLNLNDTGVLKMDGTWQRAENLRDTPLEFSLEWTHAQLGQLTKLITGSDHGWRGGMQVDVTLKGTPAKLQVVSDASVQDFRRYDITRGDALNLAGHCDGQYSSVDRMFHDVACKAPVGTGLITVKGELGLPGSRNYKVVITAENVPASGAAILAQRAKKNLPDDLAAGGTVRGSVSMQRDGAGAPLRLEGKGEIADFRLASVSNKAELGPETLPFALSSDAARVKRPVAHKDAAMRVPNGPQFEFGPLPVAIGRATARGWVNGAGYDIAVAGEAEIAKALRVARMFGLPALAAAAEGTADVDLEIAGSWTGWGYGAQSGFLGPRVTGTAKLSNVRVPLRAVGDPVEILSAELQMLPGAVHVEKLSAKAAGTVWSGSLDMPRGCGTPDACELHFNLNVNEISLGELSAWVNPRTSERPWYRVLESSAPAGPSLLGSLRASGRVSTDRLIVQSVTATHVAASVTLDKGRVRVSELNADFLGGKYHGQWQADFTARPAACDGNGKLTAASLGQLADVMKDAWISGTASATYEVKGPCSAEFWQTAEGSFQFDVKDAALLHVSLSEDEGALKISRMTGRVKLQGGKLEIKDAGLDSVRGKFLVSGTAGLNREVEMTLTRPANAAGGYAITGTVESPRVATLSGTEQARLKP
jgi:hypothetical protein